eukprot:2576505-Prymnesium_polylepis.1
MWLERGTHIAPGEHSALLFSCCRNLPPVTRRPHPRPPTPPPHAPLPCPLLEPWPDVIQTSARRLPDAGQTRPEVF